jgi:dihydropyrimidinase
MTRYDWLVHSGSVVSSDRVVRMDVAIADGVFAEIADEIDSSLAREMVDATGQLVLPGIIDAHNHPYFADGIDTFSLAAAYGGVTTLIPFAGHHFDASQKTSGLVDSVERFIAQGQRESILDFGAHAILSGAEYLPDTIAPLRELGVVSYKVFLAFPGRRMLDDGQVLAVMQAIGRSGGLVMVHCENGLAIAEIERQMHAAGDHDASAYPRSRPAPLEAEAVYRAVALARVADVDAYIVHLSSADSLEAARLAQQQSHREVFLETCPHYLFLTEDDQIAMGALAKVSPPFRRARDREALWQSVASGDIDVVATDASGQTRAEKMATGDDILAAPFGIPGVETFVPMLATAMANRDLPPQILARVLCERPAEIFGIADRKGRVAAGLDADLVLLDPARAVEVRGSAQHGHTVFSLFEGWRGSYAPTFSMQRGHPVLRGGEVVARAGHARYLPGAPRTATRTATRIGGSNT